MGAYCELCILLEVGYISRYGREESTRSVINELTRSGKTDLRMVLCAHACEFTFLNKLINNTEVLTYVPLIYLILVTLLT